VIVNLAAQHELGGRVFWYIGWDRLSSLAMFQITEIDREDFRRLLAEISVTHIPFGKYGIQKFPPRGRAIMDLPEEYLLWFQQKGFPKGRLGELMAHVCEIKSVGMDAVFEPFRRVRRG